MGGAPSAIAPRVGRLCLPIAVLLVTLSAFAQSAGAQGKLRDRVVLKLKSGNGRFTMQCEVEEYTGRFIRVKTATGTTRTYPAADVEDVKTPQTRQHVNGLLAFTQRKYKAARDFFDRAIADESRAWVRREILAMHVRCSLRLGEHRAAAERFAAIVKSDPATPHFGLIPLVWSTRAITDDESALAKNWLLKSPSSAARLIAASYLLNDSDWGGNAATAMSGLASNTDLRIKHIAQAQLWRRKLRKGTPSKVDIELWEQHVSSLPTEMRGGPYFLLGRAYLARKKNEPAAAAFLWLPLVYDRDHRLAARACMEAADALADVGKKSAAITLYREVAVRFADTPFASEAMAQGRRLSGVPRKR